LSCNIIDVDRAERSSDETENKLAALEGFVITVVAVSSAGIQRQCQLNQHIIVRRTDAHVHIIGVFSLYRVEAYVNCLNCL